MNNWTISTNAVGIGDILLNDDCIIAANAVVKENAEKGSMVGGIPAKRL